MSCTADAFAVHGSSGAGLVEQEWLTTLASVDADEVTYLDFVQEGERLAAQLRVRQGGGWARLEGLPSHPRMPAWAHESPAGSKAWVVPALLTWPGRPLAPACPSCRPVQEQGAELVVALTHMRLPNDMRLAREAPGIDLVLGGHDHDCFLLRSEVGEGHRV